MEESGHEQPKQSLSDLIPVIDLAALNGDHIDEFERKRVITEIAHACKTWGAFQLINHGIQPHVIERARAKASRVFELPSETRWKAKRSPGSLSGYGNGAVIADAVNSEIASEAITFGYPNSEADAIANKFWPRGNPDFRVSIDDYNQESHELALKVVRLIVEGLELHGNLSHFQPYLTERFGVLRINNYPTSKNPTQDIGLPPHIDDTLLTIVHQECGVEGLQLLKDGHWVTVPPRSDVMVVLVAAVCQVLTNDNYKAVLHRAVPHRDKVRLSMVYSAYPPANILITAAPEFVTPEHFPLYKPFTWSEYLSGQVTHILNPLDGFQTNVREGETQNQTSKP